MTLPSDGSYVLGNSSQLNLLTPAERDYLSQHPAVWVLNHFPTNFERIGIKPTHYLFGDTRGHEVKPFILRELLAIHQHFSDRIQRICLNYCQPLHFIYHRPEGTTEEYLEIAEWAELWLKQHAPELIDKLLIYKRGPARTIHQPILRKLGDAKVFHAHSSLTNCINLAWLLNPGPVRIVGCQFGGPCEHFYSDGLGLTYNLKFHHWIENFWSALAEMRRQGIDIIDCNVRHGGIIPEELRLPRELVWEASE